MEFSAGSGGVWWCGGAAAAADLFGSGKVLSDQGVEVVIVVKFRVWVTRERTASGIGVMATEVLTMAGGGRDSTGNGIVAVAGQEGMEVSGKESDG
jgi:hypothetical protein